MKRWLSVVGLGEGGFDDLPAVGRELIAEAEVLVGSQRHLDLVPDAGAQRLTWASPLQKTVEDIKRCRSRRVCVLATGDPMDFGIGTKLARQLPISEMLIVPSPSAFSLAAARMGWSRPDCSCLTVHSRPIEMIHPFVQPYARLLILSNDGGSPAQIASLLRERGFGPSRLSVFEHMGGGRERRVDGTAENWTDTSIADLNTVAVVCHPADGVQMLSRSPGLPDDVFRHDGQLTKREVRAMTLAALRPGPGQRLWDVGAGCGSIGIEWLRMEPYAAAIAIESNEDRVAYIRENAVALGAPTLSVVCGEAPAVLSGLEPPDAVFVGGGLTTANLIETCWQSLKSGGRLVANAVTVEGEQRLAEWHGTKGGALRRIAVTRAAPSGRFEVWQALVPVTQWEIIKS